MLFRTTLTSSASKEIYQFCRYYALLKFALFPFYIILICVVSGKFYLTTSMEQIPSSEANIRSASEEILRHFCNPKACCVHRNPLTSSGLLHNGMARPHVPDGEDNLQM
jgi:hypothetical protein